MAVAWAGVMALLYARMVVEQRAPGIWVRFQSVASPLHSNSKPNSESAGPAVLRGSSSDHQSEPVPSR